jgi:hypothetical protein
MASSWYQPAIDAFGHALMERFNKLPYHLGLASRLASGPRNAQGAELQPIVYVTYQAYLRRSVPAFLQFSPRRMTAASIQLTNLSILEPPPISHAHLHLHGRTTMH